MDPGYIVEFRFMGLEFMKEAHFSGRLIDKTGKNRCFGRECECIVKQGYSVNYGPHCTSLSKILLIDITFQIFIRHISSKYEINSNLNLRDEAVNTLNL